MNLEKGEIVIIGAGFAGLSAAISLLEKGNSVIIIELGTKPGGIAAEIKSNGYRYEMGAHLFHCPDSKIMNDIKKITGEDLVTINRTIKINFLEKYYDFPLKISEVFLQLPILTVIHAILSFLNQQFKNIFLKPKITNSEDALIKNYGKVLYKIFFKSYIKHVWGLEPSQFSSKFAEQRIPNFNILEILYKIQQGFKIFFKVKQKIDTENFVEKVEGDLFTTNIGFSGIVEKMAKKILQNGGIIHYNSNVYKIGINNKNILKSIYYKKDNKEYQIIAKGLISTMPINKMVNIINPLIKNPLILNSINKLKYRSLVFIGLIINKKNVLPGSLTYYRNLSFNRITDLSQLGIKQNNQSDISTLVAEITCDATDEIWKNNNLAKNSVIKDLVNNNIIKKSNILDSHVFHLKYAYPIYIKGYDDALDNIFNYLSRIPNLKTIGRQGGFQYINSHIAIRMGYRAAEELDHYLKPNDY